MKIKKVRNAYNEVVVNNSNELMCKLKREEDCDCSLMDENERLYYDVLPFNRYTRIGTTDEPTKQVLISFNSNDEELYVWIPSRFIMKLAYINDEKETVIME